MTCEGTIALSKKNSCRGNETPLREEWDRQNGLVDALRARSQTLHDEYARERGALRLHIEQNFQENLQSQLALRAAREEVSKVGQRYADQLQDASHRRDRAERAFQALKKEWDEWEKARMEGAQAAKKKSKKKKVKGKK